MAPNNEDPSRKREHGIRFDDERGMNSAENSIASALNRVGGDGSLDRPSKRARNDDVVAAASAAAAAVAPSSAAAPPRAQRNARGQMSAESAATAMPPPRSLPPREVSNCNGGGGGFGEKCGGRQDGIGSDDGECDSSDDASECPLVEEVANEIDGRISFSDDTFSDTDGGDESEEDDDDLDECDDKRVSFMANDVGVCVDAVGGGVGKKGGDCDGDRHKHAKCDVDEAANAVAASKKGSMEETVNKKPGDPQDCNGDSGQKAAVVSLEAEEGKDQECSTYQELGHCSGAGHRDSSATVISAGKCKGPPGCDAGAVDENTNVISTDSTKQENSHGSNKQENSRGEKNCRQGPTNTQKVDGNINVISDKPRDHPKKHHPQVMDAPSPSEDASLTCITVHFHQYGGMAPPSICGITCYYSDDGEIRSGHRRHQVRHRVHIELGRDECITRVQRKSSSFDADLGIRFYTNGGRVLTAIIEDGHIGKWYDWDGTEGLGSTAATKSSPSSSPTDGHGHTREVLWSIEYAENYHPSMIRWKSKSVQDLVTHNHHARHQHHRGKRHEDERHTTAEPSTKKPTTPSLVPVPSLARLSQAASLDRIRADMLRVESRRHERLNDLRLRCDHEVEQIVEQHRQGLRDTREAREVRRLHRLLIAAMEDLEREKDRLAERTAGEIAEVERQKISIGREIKRDWRRDRVAAAKLQRSHLQACRKRRFEGWDRIVCNEDTCREIFEPSKLPKFKRCVSGSCAKRPRNCGCSVKLCVGCEMYICVRHAETHEKTCPGWVHSA